ncbi:MAG: pilus assembly protein [Oscillospiraceae bacterium]|nr:pilus assembly protein [Oscillospiraceae bacterium]
MKQKKNIFKDDRGDAVVEATILFPIMIMIFAALVLLAMYLPTRASLQRATQFAATAVATEMGGTWIYFDENAMSHGWRSGSELRNVYRVLLSGTGEDYRGKAEFAGRQAAEGFVGPQFGTLTVDADIVNSVVFSEVVVTATRSIPLGDVVDLSFVGFPTVLEISATSSAVVVDGAGFIRNLDLAEDFADRIVKLVSQALVFPTLFSIAT